MYLAVVLLLAVMVGVLVAALAGDARLARWGTRRGEVVRAGGSPYREAETAPVLLTGAPRGLRVAAGLNAAWGVVTGLVFGPAGLVLAWFGARELGALSVAVLCVVASGFGLSIALGVAASRALRRQSLDKAKRTATWSLLHHVLVLAVMAMAAVAIDEWFIFGISILPCLFGIAFAHALRQGVSIAELGGYDLELEDLDDLDQPVEASHELRVCTYP